MSGQDHHDLIERSQPCMTHMRGVVYSRPAIIPFDKVAVSRGELCLRGRQAAGYLNDRTHTLVFVKELYTFKIGSSVWRVGIFEEGCSADMVATFW